MFYKYVEKSNRPSYILEAVTISNISSIFTNRMERSLPPCPIYSLEYMFPNSGKDSKSELVKISKHVV